MKSGSNKSGKEPARPHQGNVEIRKDLQDGSHGKDLSYLNEMPQMARYEGVKAGVPPPKDKEKSNKNSNTMADES
jgi:hypothetical protein